MVFLILHGISNYKMKGLTIMKPNKFLSFVLSLAVTSSLTVPALAGETQSVTDYISTNQNIESTTDMPAPSPDADIATDAPSPSPGEVAASIVHNIAQKYAHDGVSTDLNMAWFVADMAVYAELYPETTFVLSDAEKQACLDKIIADAATSTSPSSLAKDIIALRALGYDAKKLYTSDSECIDAVEKLAAFVDNGDAAATNAYTLPYVLIALQQNDSYATEEQLNLLIDYAVSDKASWHDTTYGVDAATPMLLALAPYYNTRADVKAVIEETIPIISDYQSDTGLIDYASSTGLAIAGLAALGISPETVVKNENTLIDGLLTQVSETNDGFIPTTNSFSTEQGFRGLLAVQLLNINKRMYDFSSYPLNEAHATAATPAPTVTPSADSGSSDSGSSDSDITVSVKIMIHDADKCNNSYTYKNNASKYTAIANESFTADKGSTVYDALIYTLNKNSIEYEIDNSGYVLSIDGLAEFDHGSKSGWQFRVNGKHIDLGSRDAELDSSSSVVWYYTDNYTKEQGSDRYSSGGGGSSAAAATTAPTEKPTPEPTAVPTKTPTESIPTKAINFTDVKDDSWYKNAVNYVTENGLFDGVTDTEFAPDMPMTRAMLVTVLFRVEKAEKPDGKSAFTDVTANAWYHDAVLWAAENGITDGITDAEFAPDMNITREQIAVILHRYSEYKGLDLSIDESTDIEAYDDYDKISEYAVQAIKYACGTGIINGVTDSTLAPQSTATRAQTAAMLMRMYENF